MTNVLYIAAKAPRPGECKTRLARAIGEEAALSLYRAFLFDIAARFENAPFDVVWYVTPEDGWSEIQSHVGTNARVVFQNAGDWTSRQRQLFRDSAARGATRTVLIGSDSPHIRVEAVQEAFALLDHHDLVFGPVLDGGYYLIGMRAFHDILENIHMSTRTVLQELIDRARTIGLSVGEVETLFDVDEFADLQHLKAILLGRDDLVATRLAMRELIRHL